jgi:hypothetical protein
VLASPACQRPMPPLPRFLVSLSHPAAAHGARRHPAPPVSRSLPHRSRPAALPCRAAMASPAPAGQGAMPVTELSRAVLGPPPLSSTFSPPRGAEPQDPPAPFFLSARATGPLKRSHRPPTSSPLLPVFLLHPLRAAPPPSSPTELIRIVPRSPRHPGVESPPPR